MTELPVNPHELAGTIGRLDAWLQTMRQEGGYGGPVAHWWQSRYQYTGPGLDWRYEGILSGYTLLLEKTGDRRWRERIEAAVTDIESGQNEDGSLRASRFELNPGTLGTPHEAAADLGLLEAITHVQNTGAVLKVVKRNLNNLIRTLWDTSTTGFNDRPGIPGRVPNKLATLALTLIKYAAITGEERYLAYARSALDDVLRFQMDSGRYAGAVHQYAAATMQGDGRFFPYYNARCIPPLLHAASTFADERYSRAARGIMDFLKGVYSSRGNWPQVVYRSGQTANWPVWTAGSADILLAYRLMDETAPSAAISRLLAGQLPGGGFRTGEGFAAQILQLGPGGDPDFRDVTPVVGWNDKVLRLLATLLPAGTPVPSADVPEFSVPVRVRGCAATYAETTDRMEVVGNDRRDRYRWNKSEPWAFCSSEVSAR